MATRSRGRAPGPDGRASRVWTDRPGRSFGQRRRQERHPRQPSEISSKCGTPIESGYELLFVLMGARFYKEPRREQTEIRPVVRAFHGEAESARFVWGPFTGCTKRGPNSALPRSRPWRLSLYRDADDCWSADGRDVNGVAARCRALFCTDRSSRACQKIRPESRRAPRTGSSRLCRATCSTRLTKSPARFKRELRILFYRRSRCSPTRSATEPSTPTRP